jgi:hypothetical protein
MVFVSITLIDYAHSNTNLDDLGTDVMGIHMTSNRSPEKCVESSWGGVRCCQGVGKMIIYFK